MCVCACVRAYVLLRAVTCVRACVPSAWGARVAVAMLRACELVVLQRQLDEPPQPALIHCRRRVWDCWCLSIHEHRERVREGE